MRIADIREAIRDGQFDQNLDRLSNVLWKEIKERRAELGEALIDDFLVGQRVKTLPGSYKPRYMFNRTGMITKIEAPWVWIELDEPVRRSGGGNTKIVRHIGVSPLYLEHVDDVPPIR